MSESQKQVNLVIQGKGGCGKTVTSVLLTQYLRGKGHTVAAYDTDPVNATFTQYKELSAEAMSLVDENKRIVPRKFDQLIENILTTDAERVVIDSGSQTFLELSHYLVSSEALELLIENGWQVVLNVVVAGGPALGDTLSGLSTVLTSYPESCLVRVWKNLYFGDVEHEGKTFEQMKVYTQNKERIHSVVTLAREDVGTTGLDIADMLTAHLTFDEAIASESTRIMAKRRLSASRERLFNQLEEAV